MPIGRVLLVVACLLGPAACAGSADHLRSDAGPAAPDAGMARADASGTAVDPARALAILSSRCAGCHGASMPQGGLDLVSGDVGARLLSHTSSCGGMPLVDRSNVANSYFLQKMEQASPRCGARMPIGGTLGAEDVATLRGWLESIARGA